MARFVLEAVSYNMSDWKHQDLSRKLASSFDNAIVDEEVISGMVDKIVEFTNNHIDGEIYGVTRFVLEQETFKFYKLGLSNQNTGIKQWFLSLQFRKMNAYYSFVDDVKKTLDGIFIL